MFHRQFLKHLTVAAGFMFIGLAGAATTSNVVVPPTLPFTDPGYLPNGRITTTVVNTPDCTSGTFTVNASPVAGSGPGGGNPPFTTVVTYIGFPAGNFLFANAGYGQYRITTTTTSCTVGTPPAPLVDIVTVAGAPTITSVLPASGSVVGGTPVVIMGTYFTGATAVTFGGTPAASFTVDSDSQISAVTPPGVAGSVPVAVTTPGGVVASGTFTYAQEVTAIPTLSEWAMIFLASLMAMFAIRRMRRQ
jgi:IPT/TIG domain/IPTL-CTERM motif